MKLSKRDVSRTSSRGPLFGRVRWNLTVLTVAIVLVLYLVSSFAVYSIVRHTVLVEVDQRLTIIARRTSRLGAISVLMNPPIGTYVLMNDGTGTQSTFPVEMQSQVEKLLTVHAQDHRWSTIQQFGDTGPYRVLYFPSFKTQDSNSTGYVLIAGDINREVSVLVGLRQVLSTVGLVGCVVATLAGFLLAERALLPVRKAWRKQLEFVADASHELRTPLAVISTNLSMAMEHTDQTIVENLEWLNNAHSELRRVNRLVADLLTLAREDAHSTPFALSPINLSELLAHVGDLFEPIAMSLSQAFSIDTGANVWVIGDKDRLHQLFVILLDNAFKYSDAPGRVKVTVTQHKTTATVTVSDTGQGIPQQDLPRVFERFYRVDKSRERGDRHGTGLGLAIARLIVEAHRGKISIASQEGVGTTVQVQLPCSSERRQVAPSDSNDHVK